MKVWIVLGTFEHLIHVDVYQSKQDAEDRAKFLREIAWNVKVQEKDLR